MGDRQKVSWLDVGSLSRSSTSQGWFVHDRLVQMSQPLQVDRLGLTLNFKHGNTEQHSIDSFGRAESLWGAWGPDRRGADGNGHRPRWSASHTDRWRRVLDRWAAVGNAGEEATMGAWTVRPLYRAHPGFGGANEAGKDGAPFSCQTAV